MLVGGQQAKTVPSCLDAEDLAALKMRGASPAGPPPAAPSPAKAGALLGGTMIEVGRAVDGDGIADLAGQRVKIGAKMVRRVTLRLDGHLMHVISGDDDSETAHVRRLRLALRTRRLRVSHLNCLL